MAKKRVFTAEHRRKISLAKMGNRDGVANLINRTGIKHTQEAKDKISMAHKGKSKTEEHNRKNSEAQIGEKNHQWKGGISKDKEYLRFQKNMHTSIRRRKLKGSFTLMEWKDLKKKYGNTCPACGIEEPEIKLTADHIIPVSKGGVNTIDNIQPLCRECNMRKFTKMVSYIKREVAS